MHQYGVRYIPVPLFINLCKDLNVKIDAVELEYYDQTGVFLPVARVLYPDEYIIQNTQLAWGTIVQAPIRGWLEIEHLSEKFRVDPDSYADLTDEEISEPFDRERGTNPYLIQPKPEDFKPWSNYKVTVPIREGLTDSSSTAEHYYSYWQVHQLHLLQGYPDLYQNRGLLGHIAEDVKTAIFRPRPLDKERLRGFDGKAHRFDALSFWVSMFSRERKRTFALVPERDRIRELNASQAQGYRDRLLQTAKTTLHRFGLTVEDLHKFLFEIVELYSDYRQDERFKLADELRKDVFSLADLIEIIHGEDWDKIADELGKRSIWAKETFRHMDVLTKERDEARDVLKRSAEQYGDKLDGLGITTHTFGFTEPEIDELLDFLEKQGLSLLWTALSGMVAIGDESAEKFRRVTRYTNLKNILTSFEYFLKEICGRGGVVLTGHTLTPVVQSIMSGESGWITLFAKKVGQGLISAHNTNEFRTNLRRLQNDPELVQSEDTFWARVLLMTCLARNGTVHGYPSDDWYYGDLYGEMLNAVVFAIFYAWQLAKKEKWV